MNATDMTPELKELVTAARELPPDLIRQVADFAEFIGSKHFKFAFEEVMDVDDDEVDLGGGIDKKDWSDLSGVLLDGGGHSAIGLV
jgi:hypothetical protein